MPAIDNWTTVLPLAVWFVVSFAIALYVGRLGGSWRFIYVVGTVVALYLNVNVAVVQV